MGSGKTSVGQLLAESLNWPFLDTDQAIESKIQKTATEVFETAGETAWRALELELAQTLPQLPPHVISTGGGFCLNPTIQTLLKSSGTVIWLEAHVETLWKRLEHDQNRPLLETKDKKERLHTLTQKRTPVYAQTSDYKIQTDTLTPTEICLQIQKNVSIRPL